jgi:hypothetical protein
MQLHLLVLHVLTHHTADQRVRVHEDHYNRAILSLD